MVKNTCVDSVFIIIAKFLLEFCDAVETMQHIVYDCNRYSKIRQKLQSSNNCFFQKRLEDTNYRLYTDQILEKIYQIRFENKTTN